MNETDASLEKLLFFDKQVFVVDPESGHWIKFIAHRGLTSLERPHGIGYLLTLHGPDGERLVGFDNAHPVRFSGLM